MMILRRTYKSTFILSWILCLSVKLQAQAIDISSGMNELKSQVSSIYMSAFDIILYLIGIGALIGLVVAVYKLYADQHDNGWMTAAKWCAGLLFAGVALYVLKQIKQ